jgi:hypothetical protein
VRGAAWDGFGLDDGYLVVRGHGLHERLIEAGPGWHGGQVAGHRAHAGIHVDPDLREVGRGAGRRLGGGESVPGVEPARHPADLLVLAGDDFLGQGLQIGPAAPGDFQPCHGHGSGVVRDHPAQECLLERVTVQVPQGGGVLPGHLQQHLIAAGLLRGFGNRVTGVNVLAKAVGARTSGTALRSRNPRQRTIKAQASGLVPVDLGLRHSCHTCGECAPGRIRTCDTRFRSSIPGPRGLLVLVLRGRCRSSSDRPNPSSSGDVDVSW